MRTLAAALVLLASLGVPASAADHVVGGRQLTLVHDARRASLVLVLRDPPAPLTAPAACFCIEPCSGGDPFPACNGTCSLPGWTCQTGPDSCGCLPPP